MSRKKKFKRILLCALLISLPFIQSFNKANDKVDNLVTMCVNNDTISYNNYIYKDSIKNELIGEVECYIFKKYPKAHKDIPSLIVENGLEHNIDILFMMAQTQNETSYGTLGAGRESSRRSLFGIAVRKYNNYENAIVDYIKILKKSYLTKGRTEQHLMRKYVTSGGSRYATDPNYEITLRKTYAELLKQTKIKELQIKYMNSDA